MTTNNHEVIFAIVNAGFAEEAMEVAREEGVRGGTILNARGVAREEAAAFFGAERTALDLQRLMMDFPLPCPGGMGSPLKQEQLGMLMGTYSPMTFYSADLSAKYFTYCENGLHHFVLYDDAHTLREKIRLGQSMGFCAAFLMYPEIEDLLEQLSAK